MSDESKTVEQRLTEIVDDVRRAERARIATILNHPHAAGRRTLAEHLALNTSTPIDEAITVLSVAAKSQPPELHAVASSRTAC